MIREGFKGRAKLCANHDNAGRGAGHEEGGTRVPMGELRKKVSRRSEAGSRERIAQLEEIEQRSFTRFRGFRMTAARYKSRPDAGAGGSDTRPYAVWERAACYGGRFANRPWRSCLVGDGFFCA